MQSYKVLCKKGKIKVKHYDRGGLQMELAEIRHELENIAETLAGFRGSL